MPRLLTEDRRLKNESSFSLRVSNSGVVVLLQITIFAKGVQRQRFYKLPSHPGDANEKKARMMEGKHVRTILDVLSKAQCLLDLCRIREATVLYRGQNPKDEQIPAAYQMM